VATAVAILATATVGLTTGLVAVSAEKNRTEVARQGEAWQRARAVANEKEARDKADESRAVLDFVKNNILAVARPEGAKGGDLIHITLLKALQLALPEVKSSFERLPLVESEVRVALGESFLYVGDAGTAERQFQIARERYTAVLGPLHPVTLSSMNNLANAYAALGRHVDALELNEKTLALRKSKLGPDHRDTLSSMNNLANNYRSVGRHAEALKLYEEVLTRRKSELGPDHPDTLMSMTNLASTYAALGRLADALKLFDEALATAKAKLGPDHPVTLAGMINLAGTYAALGRHADALKLREETLAVQKAKLGPDHPDTLLTMNNLAVNYSNLGRHADALKLNEETLALLKANLGTDHPDTLLTMANLAGCLLTLDRRSEALAIADDCLRRANGKTVDPRLVPFVLDLRLRVFAKQKDASGCRQTAGMWEKLARTDADSLYTAACFRAVTAGILPPAGQTRDAGLAMGWLTKAVAAGYSTPRNFAQMMRDHDLDALRDRADFRRLFAELFDRGFPADPFAK